jgi:hypothetical protein
MRSLGVRRRALRALVVLVAAVAGLAVAGLAATSDEPSKPGPVVREGAVFGTPIPPPDEAADPTPLTGSVPARAAEPDAARCPNDWSYFDNPAMHYGLCTPPGWGFSNFSSPGSLERIPTAQLENLHLLGNAFPWHPGTLPFDAVRAGAFDVELDLVPAGAAADGECEPVNPVLAGTLTFLSCEQLYDDTGLPALIGTLRAIKVAVPLRSEPADGAGTSGARLLVIARARATALPQEVTTLWQIIRSIRTY